MTDYVAKMKALVAGDVTADDFSHLDHCGTAFEAIRSHGFFEALHLYADGLKALTERAGVPEKFNATITFAYLSRIAERMEAAPATDFDTFAAANPDILSLKAVLRDYPETRLRSALARQVALLPDPMD